MSKLIINGWKSLHGKTTPVPNKNSIIKLIPATILTHEPVILRNVPQTSDVKYMLQIVEKLWWSYEWLDDSSVRLEAWWVNSTEIDAELSVKMKASVMFAGPLLARFGNVSMPTPQWCKLGTRPLDAFIENMSHMGCEYTYADGSYDISCKTLVWTTVHQRFPSVTATENVLLMAVLAKWTTVIHNAACEPHTQDLCNMLVSMWAKIQGIWSNRLEVAWVERLGGTEWTVISDHLDVAWLITATVMTWGEITISNAVVEHMQITLQAMQKLWIHVTADPITDTIHVGKQDTLNIKKTIKGDILELSAGPWPLLPMDLMPVLLVLALHCEGSAMISNSYYSSQFFFVQELMKMKWRTVMADPHRIITFGPAPWQPANMLCGDIIQSSYGMLMACLAAPGQSTLNAITPLFRRFPNFVDEFNALGADITLVD